MSDERCSVAGKRVTLTDESAASLLAPALDELADVTRERDALRTENEGLRKHTDAAVDGVRAMLPAALGIARRDGAEAMRELALQALAAIRAKHAEREAAVRAEPETDTTRPALIAIVNAIFAIDTAREAIRALDVPAK